MTLYIPTENTYNGLMVWMWVGFIGLVLALLALDLFVFHRKAHQVKVREALLWSAFWIALSLGFNVLIYFMYEGHWMGLGTHPSPSHPQGLGGSEAAILFFTGYVIEKSLSVDNLFVMALIFGYFSIPAAYQHRVLFWGILGALVMRGAMIGLGAALIDRFEWILYVFGAILLYTAWKMLRKKGEPDPRNNFMIRWTQRVFPVTHEIHGMHFIIRDPHPEGGAKVGRRVLTPLALALIVVETTDLVFAVDSIPAIFAVTTDPFIVFTSNIFAILGLRSLYFALAGVMDKFKYLEVSLAVVLALVGVKMLARNWLHDIPGINFWLLGLVAVILLVGVIASLAAGRGRRSDDGLPPAPNAPAPGPDPAP